MDSLISAIILFVSTALIGCIFLYLPFKKDKSLKILLSFSGAFLFALTILHFLPSVFEHYKPAFGYCILLGFSVQILLEFLTKGIDHGHYHKGHNTALHLPALIGLFLHALFEATPLAHSEGHSHGEGFHEFFMGGLILHKLPVTIVFATMLSQYISKKNKSIAIILAFALMAPLGLMLSEFIVVLQDYHEYFMSFVIGIFLYISTTILFEINEHHNFNIMKLLSIISGFGIALLMSVL